MATAPFADGTPGASQWPIPPGHFFDYEIHVPVDMEGTYFYHSHVGFQGVSATGPLIIERKKKPSFRYDEERIFFLQDVFRKNDSTIEKGLEAAPLQWSGESDMILVNGKGGGDSNGIFCNASLSTIDVRPGRTYFFRFIGATALTFASIVLEDHEFEIVEVDGQVQTFRRSSCADISTVFKSKTTRSPTSRSQAVKGLESLYKPSNSPKSKPMYFRLSPAIDQQSLDRLQS